MPYTYSLNCHTVQKTGAHQIKIASPYSSVSPGLQNLGIATDGIRYQNHPFYLDVHGDRNGGTSGPPIEKQYLGEIIIVSFTLSSFDPAVVDIVRKRGVLGSNGYLNQPLIGSLLLSTRSMRLLILPELEADVRNFWCAVPVQAFEVTEGSKFSEWSMVFECHRPPCGHAWAGVMEDKSWGAYRAPNGGWTQASATPPSTIGDT